MWRVNKEREAEKTTSSVLAYLNGRGSPKYRVRDRIGKPIKEIKAVWILETPWKKEWRTEGQPLTSQLLGPIWGELGGQRGDDRQGSWIKPSVGCFCVLLLRLFRFLFQTVEWVPSCCHGQRVLPKSFQYLMTLRCLNRCDSEAILFLSYFSSGKKVLF